MNRQQELDTFNDAELEKLVCIYHDVDMVNSESHEWDEGQHVFWPMGRGSVRPLKYCSNPSDIMPIAIEHRFKMVPHNNANDVDVWRVRTVHTDIVESENLYRAICIVFILMMEGKR